MVKSRQLKNGQIRFYDGNKKASKNQRKEYLRDVVSGKKVDIILSGTARGASLLGAVKGGIKRSGAQRINGQFIEGKIQRGAKRLGLDLDVLIKGNNVKNLKELFKKKPDLEKAINKILSGVGLPQWFNPDKVLDIISDYPGKNILVNGKKETKNHAKSLVKKMENAIKLQFNPVQSAQKITFIGVDTLSIELPEYSQFVGLETIAEFNAKFKDFYILYESNPR